jgi:hypothetical protein
VDLIRNWLLPRIKSGAGFSAITRARDQQKWTPVLRPIARKFFKWRMILSENRFPLFGIMR